MFLRVFITTACVVASSATLADDISKIQCRFVSDNFKGGKSNEVSCAMTPNEVFSSNNHQHPANELCDQKSNRFNDHYLDYVVDLTTGTVEYDMVSNIADFAKGDYARYLMEKHGKTQEEATRDVENRPKRHVTHDISNIDKGFRRIFLRAGGGIYNPPKELPTYIIRYDENTLYYTVGVAEAVLITSTGHERNSWINIKFGMCDSE